MSEIVVNKHSFEEAKNRIKEFSEIKEAELAINEVKKDGSFLGLGDHKVTGREFNDRMETIQNHLIDINKTNNKTIKEFREIYNALETLDKDYISRIVASIKAIEKTSNDVRVQQGILSQHNKKIQTQQNKLDAHQGDIENIVENLKKTVTVLKSFKEKLDGFKHLTDIDKIWSDCNTIHNEIKVVSDSIEKMSKKLSNDISIANGRNKEMVDKTNENIILVNKDTKSIKDTLSKLTSKINQTTGVLEKQIPIIKDTSFFINHIRDIKHLDEVDYMWEQGKSLQEDFSRANDDIVSLTQKVIETEKELNEYKSQTESVLEKFEKKTKYAYFVAGGSLGLAIFELIIIMAGGI